MMLLYVNLFIVVALTCWTGILAFRTQVVTVESSGLRVGTRFLPFSEITGVDYKSTLFVTIRYRLNGKERRLSLFDQNDWLGLPQLAEDLRAAAGLRVEASPAPVLAG